MTRQMKHATVLFAGSLSLLCSACATSTLHEHAAGKARYTPLAQAVITIRSADVDADGLAICLRNSRDDHASAEFTLRVPLNNAENSPLLKPQRLQPGCDAPSHGVTVADATSDKAATLTPTLWIRRQAAGSQLDWQASQHAALQRIDLTGLSLVQRSNGQPLLYLLTPATVAVDIATGAVALVGFTTIVLLAGPNAFK